MFPDLILFNSLAIPIKVAISAEEQAKGLMWEERNVLMAFPYKEAAIRKFWMCNTPKPLDIIFCRANSVLAIVMGSPFSLEHVGPEEPSDLIIEMPYGYAEKLGLQVGSSFLPKYSSYNQLRMVK